MGSIGFSILLLRAIDERGTRGVDWRRLYHCTYKLKCSTDFFTLGSGKSYDGWAIQSDPFYSVKRCSHGENWTSRYGIDFRRPCPPTLPHFVLPKYTPIDCWIYIGSMQGCGLGCQDIGEDLHLRVGVFLLQRPTECAHGMYDPGAKVVTEHDWVPEKIYDKRYNYQGLRLMINTSHLEGFYISRDRYGDLLMRAIQEPAYPARIGRCVARPIRVGNPGGISMRLAEIRKVIGTFDVSWEFGYECFE